MKPFNHWMVCLDLTDMDEFLLDYQNFLVNKLKPEKITFLHIVEKSASMGDLADLFPGLGSDNDVRELIKEEIIETIKNHIEVKIDWSVVIESGTATETIIKVMNIHDPDLLILGKKSGYEGEGVIAKKIVKYVPCSVLFIPETAKFQVESMLMPFDFTTHSASILRFGSQFANACNAKITAQHVYQYPTQSWPGIPIDEFVETMDDHLNKKLAEFKKEHSLPEDIEYIFTLNKNKKIPDKIYDQSIRDKRDMILTGARTKSTLANMLMDDLADRMIHYSFGIPLLVIKDKNQYKGLIESILNR